MVTQTPKTDGASPQTDGGIEIEDLSVQFGSQSVLSNISLRVASGEIVALIGASGCGKSTLLRTIAGLTPPTLGSVSLGRAKNAQLGFVFQDATLVPWRNVRRNITLPLELGSPGRKAELFGNADALVPQALQDVELQPHVADQMPHELSGGMRMRVSLARALVGDPDILLLDEPLGALDDLLRSKLHKLLLSLHAKRPRTILFVTHNIDEAVLLSDRIFVLGPNSSSSDSGHSQLRIYENRLPQPRSSQSRGQSEYSTAYNEITELLEQVNS